jgi:hypothetical protein
VRLVGEALGRTNDAEQLLIDYDREASQARRAIRAAGAGGGGGAARKPRVAVVRVTAGGLRFAKPDSFAGTILADAGARQVQALANADAILLSSAPGATTHVDGSFSRVDAALWWGAGGALAGRAALAELQGALEAALAG